MWVSASISAMPRTDGRRPQLLRPCSFHVWALGQSLPTSSGFRSRPDLLDPGFETEGLLLWWGLGPPAQCSLFLTGQGLGLVRLKLDQC